jgi:hypothetical protein
MRVNIPAPSGVLPVTGKCPMSAGCCVFRSAVAVCSSPDTARPPVLDPPGYLNPTTALFGAPGLVAIRRRRGCGSPSSTRLCQRSNGEPSSFRA